LLLNHPLAELSQAGFSAVIAAREEGLGFSSAFLTCCNYL
jgi:hypothetical protein